MLFSEIRSPEDMHELVLKAGFLPLLKNDIEGFSIEEHTPRELWFADDAPGPWEWKGPVIQMGGCVYGKFFSGKAGFISLECFSDFLNYRRDGYDFDARYDDGLASRKDKHLYDTLAENGSLLTGQLRNMTNYRKGGNKGFEGCITRLQMQTYVVVSNFEYKIDAQGRQYGWGVARYTTPEEQLGQDFVESAYQRQPEESRLRVYDSLRKLLPQTDERQLWRVIG